MQHTIIIIIVSCSDSTAVTAVELLDLVAITL